MNPWLGVLVDERVRELRAVAARSRAGRRDHGRRATAARTPATGGRARGTGLAHRAARALTGRRLRPV